MKEIIIEVPDEFGKTLKPWKANAEIKGELVRCKDCKHWDYRTEGCMHLTGRIAPIVKTGADWYCCDGERKDT